MTYEQYRDLEQQLATIEIEDQLLDGLRVALDHRRRWNELLTSSKGTPSQDMVENALADLPEGPLLVTAAPGLGKTYHTVQIAEILWKKSQDKVPLAILHLGPTHKSFDNVDRQPYWAHWRGHDNGSESGKPCPMYIAFSKGYRHPDLECECGVDSFDQDAPITPTFAPVEYVLADQPDGPPLRAAALNYVMWVFDDIGVDKFVDTMIITRKDVELTAQHHPFESVRTLAKALQALLVKHTAVNKGKARFDRESWSGVQFWTHLEIELKALNSSIVGYLEQWKQEFAAGTWPIGSWIEDNDHHGPGTWPCNFALRITLFMYREAIDHQNGNISGPHVHVVHDHPADETTSPPGTVSLPYQSIIRMRWRKFIPRSALPKTVILDATGDAKLLSRLLGRPVTKPESLDMIFPPTMKVRQCWGVHVSKQTVEHHLGDGRSILKAKYRQLVKEELSERKESGAAKKVGVITFKSLVPDCVKALTELGYTYSENEAESEIVVGWYYNQRGANDFKSCDILLLIGYPSPNPQGLYEEACAIYEDDEPISTESENYTARMELRNGQTLEITKPLFGYKDQRLHGLLLNKSLSELYQAFHRARPFGLSTSVKEVLLFTDVPVPGVLVDGFIGREGKVLETLRKLLSSAEVTADGVKVVEKDHLVDEIEEQYPGLWPTIPALDRWIRRASPWLQAVTATEYADSQFRTIASLDSQ